MGRLLKRVALDFDWPINKTWKGFINPHYEHCHRCRTCDGTGQSHIARALSDEWYGRYKDEWVWIVPGKIRYNKYAWEHNLTQEDVDALVAAKRLLDFTHTFTPGKGWEPKDPPYHPTAEEVNQWSLPGQGNMGHDSLNSFVCVRARVERLGLGKDAHICKTCKGEGNIWDSPEDKIAAEAWKDEEPPVGEGFQLWENTSEGSPQTPVFETIEELCLYCEKNCTTFGSNKATYREWMQMLDKNFVCHSMTNGNTTMIFI